MDAQGLTESLRSLPPIMIVAAIIAILLVLAGIRLLFRKTPAHLTAFAGEAGNVLVSRKAIQELIEQTCMLDELVESAQPRIRFSDSKVHTYVELRLSSSDDLKGSSERVQDRITELLKKSLNFDQIGDIEIVVKSFGTESANVQTPPKASHPEEVDFGETNEDLPKPLTESKDGKQKDPSEEN
ncbi:alkaline shock response membrane anchor protein AmaP [Puniceicoccaceae bacterium K14]|nr:alkaline shock response membrane anchor protein AmaP [Puniceicoccaceae bacterium K14]